MSTTSWLCPSSQAPLHNLSERYLGKPTHSKRDMAAVSNLLLLEDILTEPWLVAQTRVGTVGNTHTDTQRKVSDLHFNFYSF